MAQMKNFRNALITTSLITLLLPLHAAAEGYVKKGSDLPWDIILITADVLSAGAAVWAVADQVSAAGEYENLYSQINGSSEDNYYRLLYEREKVVSKETTAVIAVSAASVLLAYTLADVLFLKNAFPVRMRHAGAGVLGVCYFMEF